MSKRSDLKILVIDDSETNQVLLEAVLEDEGYLVKTAFSSDEAFKFLKNDYKPNLILLDLLMPNVSGFDFLKKIKLDNELKDIPVVIVTAFASKENIKLANELGAADIIEKPIDIPDFLIKVNKSFNRLSV